MDEFAENRITENQLNRRQFLFGLASMPLVLSVSAGLVAVMPSAPALASRYGPTPQFSLRTAEDLLSRYRRAHGLAPMRVQNQLQHAAVRQAALMARKGKLAHYFGGATRLQTRVKAVGFRGPAAENVAAGQRSLEAVIASWQKSPGHRENLLRRGFNSFGLAVHTNPNVRYGHYWAMVIGA